MKKKLSLGKALVLYLPAIIIPGLLKWSSIPLFTRLLTTEEYANYALFIALLGMLSSLNSWIGMSVIRFYPEFESKNKSYEFSYGMLLYSIFFAVCIAVIGAVCVLLFYESNISTIYLVVIGVFLFLFIEFSNLLLYIVRIQQSILVFGLFNTWKSLSLVALGGLCAYFINPNLESILIGYTLGLVLGLPMLYLHAIYKKKQIETPPVKEFLRKIVNLSFFKKILLFGFPLMLAEFAVWGLRFSDRWLMGLMVGKTELGIYDASYGVIEATILILVSLFQLAIRPYEVNNWEGASDKEVGVLTNKMVSIYILLVLPVSILFICVSDLLIDILLPSNYKPGSTIIPWIVFAMFFLGLQQRVQSILVYKKKTNGIAIGAALGLIINFTLNLIFIPKYTLLAASINTTIGYFIFCAVIFVSSQKVLKWEFPIRLTFKLTLLSFLVIPVVFLIKNYLLGQEVYSVINLLISGGLGLIVFAVFISMFKEKSLIINLLK